jgi:hypothetical protein
VHRVLDRKDVKRMAKKIVYKGTEIKLRNEMSVKSNWLVRVRKVDKILIEARKSYEHGDIARDAFEKQLRFAIRKLEHLVSDVSHGVCDIREEGLR